MVTIPPSASSVICLLIPVSLHLVGPSLADSVFAAFPLIRLSEKLEKENAKFKLRLQLMTYKPCHVMFHTHVNYVQ